MRALFLITVLFFSFNALFAQRNTKFSTAHDVFITELAAFFEGVESRDQRREGRLLIENFRLVWNNFNDDKKNIVIENANRMMERRFKPFPQFNTYLTLLINYSNSTQKPNNFEIYHTVLSDMFTKSRGRHYMSFIEFGEKLFLNNFLYSSSTTQWRSSNSNFEFKNDDVPYIVFENLDLIGYTNNDSTVIYNTKGTYYPIDNIWKGQGGLISWERAGLSKDQVWVELGTYEINLKFARFDLDSVVFYNKLFFDEPLIGSLSERVLADVKPETASYPRFKSYDLRLRIENIFENINYEGGFTMHGAKLIGAGDKDTDAYLVFKRNNEDFIVAASQTFVISSDRVSSSDAKITLYYEKDSIFHPSLQLRYIDARKEVNLIRDRKGLSNSPFFNTYHKLDMFFEALTWNMNDPKIDISMIKGVNTESTVMFESANFFSEHRYERIQGLDQVNPLVEIFNYERRFKTKEFHLNDMASFLRISVDQTKILLLNLANMGFISYDLNYDKIIIRDRLYQYLNSKIGKVDYDVIQFHSSVNQGVNASINLLNFDLNLRGVERVFLSDSQNVVIFPLNQELTVKKNRDFTFDGKVNAGLFEYFGKLYSFEYDNFKLNMPVVDSLTFKVQDKTKQRDNYGRYPLIRVRSVIEGVSGELLIDAPHNKSGLQPFDDYPIFHSHKDAYVYYNKGFIHNGVYDKDKFFFHLEPFTIDSLNTFSTEGLEFKGYLASADIFPDIYEPLKVQPDYSLGFVRKTPDSGYPVYGGKGQYFDLINLSNKGLLGHGTLNYLSSVSKSDKFVFFPDSMVAVVQSFVLNEQTTGIEYPDVQAKNAHERWLPYQDKMIVSKIKEPIEMYNKQSRLHGAITLTPNDLTGQGTMAFNDAEMDSELFKFKNLVFDADTADFRLKTFDLSELAFATQNYKSHIDFVNRKGEFKSNGGGSKVEFPVNQYICYMDQFDWYMDKEEIDLAVDVSEQMKELEGKSIKEIADIDISGSEFVSIHPDQDSLRFISPRAKYNLRNNTIFAENVKIIRVADAAVFPGNGIVTIYRRAKMETLKEAQVLANMATKYHTLHNAIIDIVSRKRYFGTAYYDYIDDTGDKQLIFFEKIDVDTTTQTYAHGKIEKSAHFTLSPNFKYNGNVQLTASKEFLYFDGATLINNSCDTNLLHWVKFKTDINPADIFIPISPNMVDENNVPLFASLMQSTDTVYTAFLSPKIKTTDIPIASSDGFLYYDKDRKVYKIASMDKLRQFNLSGNYFSLDNDNCFTYNEGKILLSNNLGRVEFDIYGNAMHDIPTGSTKIDALIALDFFFTDDAMKILLDNLSKYFDMPPVDISREAYIKALTEYLGMETADRILSDLNLVGRIRGRFPQELQKTFVLSHVQMQWNPKTRSYQSFGKIGIGNMQRNLINKYVDGHIELIQRRGGDQLHIYLELDKNDWYYFSYQNRVMQAFSSHKEFMAAITELKPQNRRLKSDKGEAPYSFYISSERRVKDFLKKFADIEEVDINEFFDAE